MNYMNFPVTITTIAFCAIIWAIQYFASKKSNSQSIVYKYALIPSAVKSGQYYRIVTSGFMHVRPYHILMNCIALYNLGSGLESYLSSPIFAFILLLSIIGSGIACTYLSKQDSMTIGISGGVFGLLATYIVILYKLNLLGNPDVYSDIVGVLVANLIISLMPGVSWQGHLGGFLTGLVIAFILV